MGLTNCSPNRSLLTFPCIRPANAALQPRRARSLPPSHDDTRAVGCKLRLGSFHRSRL